MRGLRRRGERLEIGKIGEREAEGKRKRMVNKEKRRKRQNIKTEGKDRR